MKKKKSIPHSYFNNQEFLESESSEEFDSKIPGILGKDPSLEQVFKFEICKTIGQCIRSHGLNNLDAADIIGIDSTDVSRVVNCQIHRFTIDRLLKIYGAIEKPKVVWSTLSKLAAKMA